MKSLAHFIDHTNLSPVAQEKDIKVLCDEAIKYDFVWGNLPFHNGGKSFVPGLAKFNKDNKMITKPEKLVTIWTKMIHFIFHLK